MHGVPISQIAARCARRGVDIRRSRATASRSSSRRCSATASSTPTCIPGNIFVAHRRRDARPLHRARLRHHGHADRRRQELPRAELPRLLQPRLPPRRAGAPRMRAGCRRHARRRVRGGDPRGVRADLRPAAEGHLTSASCCCACSRPRAASTSRSSRSSCCCRRRCSTSKASAASSTRTSTCGRTAKPFLERWMSEQIGWRGLVRNAAPRGAVLGERRCRSCRGSCTARSPRTASGALRAALERLAAENARRNRSAHASSWSRCVALVLLGIGLL